MADQANLWRALETFTRVVVEREGTRFRSAILFGSHVRSDACADSDVDVAVVLDGGLGDAFDAALDLSAIPTRACSPISAGRGGCCAGRDVHDVGVELDQQSKLGGSRTASRGTSGRSTPPSGLNSLWIALPGCTGIRQALEHAKNGIGEGRQVDEPHFLPLETLHGALGGNVRDGLLAGGQEQQGPFKIDDPDRLVVRFAANPPASAGQRKGGLLEALRELAIGLRRLGHFVDTQGGVVVSPVAYREGAGCAACTVVGGADREGRAWPRGRRARQARAMGWWGVMLPKRCLPRNWLWCLSGAYPANPGARG